MKWLIGLILAILLIAGALYGVGRFVLLSDVSVTSSIEIERPRASVYAMINDLRIVKEWSPYYALDPDADYTFSGGDGGQGQTMRWSSTVREVGEGSLSIVRTQENREVESILDLGDRATLNSRMTLSPKESSTNVSWTVSATCGDGMVNVPCRYMNLIIARMIERDLANGLERLKTLTEQLPDVDFEGLNPEFLNVEPQAYVYSPITTSNQDPAQVEEALTIGVTQVDDFMTRFDLVKAGPQMRVTTEWNAAEQRMSFRVGFPFSGPTPLTVVGVQIGETPSGQALRVLHEGPRSEIRDTYAKIYAFLQAHRIPVREDGLPWEVVLRDGGGSRGAQVEIYVPLE